MAKKEIVLAFVETTLRELCFDQNQIDWQSFKSAGQYSDTQFTFKLPPTMVPWDMMNNMLRPHGLRLVYDEQSQKIKLVTFA